VRMACKNDIIFFNFFYGDRFSKKGGSPFLWGRFFLNAKRIVAVVFQLST
jgi:hypothetical protein